MFVHTCILDGHPNEQKITINFYLSKPSGVAGAVELSASAVGESRDLVKVERTRRRMTLCPTTRRISDKSCFVMPANMASEVIVFSARMSTRAAGMSCFEQNFSSQGKLSPA